MPYIAQVALGNKPSLTIFGDDYNTPDGTGTKLYKFHAVLKDFTIVNSTTICLQAFETTFTSWTWHLATLQPWPKLKRINFAIGYNFVFKYRENRLNWRAERFHPVNTMGSDR